MAAGPVEQLGAVAERFEATVRHLCPLVHAFTSSSRTKEALEFHAIAIPRIPKQVVSNSRHELISLATRGPEGDHAAEVLGTEHLIHKLPNMVQVLVTDLNEDAAGRGQQLTGE